MTCSCIHCKPKFANRFIMKYFIISGIVFLARTIIMEIAKSKRINQFKKIDNSKINAVGNYEKKSKNKNHNCYIQY